MACEGCLARHHAACWTDAGACGACHETACVVPAGVSLEPSVARAASDRTARKGDDPLEADVAVHELALQGDPPVWLAAEQVLVVLARAPDSVEPLAVRVHNGTDRPQKVELRTAPAWLIAAGEGVVAAPGETATLRLEARVADGPPNEPDPDDRPLPASVSGCGQRITTSITLHVGELVKTVAIDLVRPYDDGTLRRWSWFLSFLFVMPFVYVNARSVAASPVNRGPVEPQASWLLRRRVAAESARQAAIAGQVLLRWGALVVVAARRRGGGHVVRPGRA